MGNASLRDFGFTPETKFFGYFFNLGFGWDEGFAATLKKSLEERRLIHSLVIIKLYWNNLSKCVIGFRTIKKGDGIR